jgi:hypothetical protein
MINGIIKLFYSEVVKAKMKKMPNNSYEVREKWEKIGCIASKIDNLFFTFFKSICLMLLILIGFNINMILGIGIFMVEFIYIIYKRNVEENLKNKINNLKTNISETKISDKSKSGINLLITLLIIGILTNFNLPIILSFIVVFIFTIKEIYSKIK